MTRRFARFAARWLLVLALVLLYAAAVGPGDLLR